MLRHRWKSGCGKVRGMLSEYIDGALSSEDRGTIEEHINACQSCAKELESLRMTVAMLHRVPEVAVPRSFAISVSEERRPGTYAPRSMRWLRPATAFATIALVALLLVDFLPVFAGNGAIDEGELITQPPSSTVTVPAAGGEGGLFEARQDGLAAPTPGPLLGVEEKSQSEGANLEDSGATAMPDDALSADEPAEGWALHIAVIAVGVIALALMVMLVLNRQKTRKLKEI